MATEVAAAVNLGMAIAAMAATGAATRLKIHEAQVEYESEIARLQAAQRAQEAVAEADIQRAKQTGAEILTERGKQGEYDTRMALMQVEQTASSAEAKLGASGLKAGGTALAVGQQKVDIAYAGARRTAEAAASGMTVGGLQLRNQLASGREQKSLLTLEYQQNITEQQRKLAQLRISEPAMIAYAYAGGLAGVTSSFYQSTQTKLWDWMKKAPPAGPQAQINPANVAGLESRGGY